MPEYITLIGNPGSGKTFYGQEASRISKLPFHDTDEMILRHTGCDPASRFRGLRPEEAYEQEINLIRSRLPVSGVGILATSGSLPMTTSGRELILSVSKRILLLLTPIDECVSNIQARDDGTSRIIGLEDYPDLSSLLLARQATMNPGLDGGSAHPEEDNRLSPLTLSSWADNRIDFVSEVFRMQLLRTCSWYSSIIPR